MTWPLAIKIYAALALLFPACWAVIGYRLQKRKETKREYDWWASPVIQHDFPHDLEPVIRAEELI